MEVSKQTSEEVETSDRSPNTGEYINNRMNLSAEVGAENLVLSEGKYGLSVEAKREAQSMFEESGLPVPTNDEMDRAADHRLGEDGPEKTAEYIVEKVTAMRERKQRDTNNPHIKTALDEEYREEYLFGCSKEIIEKIYRERFPGQALSGEDRIPLPTLRRLVRENL